jgi:hypothetical protein
LLEERYGLGKKPLGTRTCEAQSFFGCVVHNMAAAGERIAHERAEWQRRSRYLPPLENGSVLLDGDVIMLARVPLRATLYVQDVFHRHWLVTLLRQYLPRSEYVAWCFNKSLETYDLRFFVARLVAMAEAKEKEHSNAAKQQRQLEERLINAKRKYAASNSTAIAELDFTNMHRAPFGTALLPQIEATLRNVCIDMNQRTKLFSRIIRESGGEIEAGETVARRLGIADRALVALVRDIVHAYQPKHCSNLAAPLSVALTEEKDVPPAAATDTDRRDMEEKHEEQEDEQQQQEEEEEAEEEEECTLEDEVIEQLAKLRRREPAREDKVAATEKTEDEKIQAVIVDAASAVQNVIYNTQLYCLTCDVPGHHTCDCPRHNFMEQLRLYCRVSCEVFYASENGICPCPQSLLAQYAAKNFHSRAGIINRRNFRTARQRDNVVVGLPPVAQPLHLRWIAD